MGQQAKIPLDGQTAIQWRQTILWMLLFMMFLGSGCHGNPPAPGANLNTERSQNQPLVGKFAKVDRVTIPLVAPQEFDGKTLQEILALRRAEVTKHPELLGKYEPYMPIFGQIIDKAPWWGLEGLFYWGPGEHGIDGVSGESRYILNPFLLVGWDSPARYYAQALAKPWPSGYQIPIYCREVSLRWEPKDKRVLIFYDGSNFERALTLMHLPLKETPFNIKGENAKDMGFNYMYFHQNASKGVIQRDAPQQATVIKRFYHRGNSCKFPGGCNNGSPFQKEFEDIYIQRLPAKAVVKLWRNMPASVNEPADMTVEMAFLNLPSS